MGRKKKKKKLSFAFNFDNIEQGIRDKITSTFLIFLGLVIVLTFFNAAGTFGIMFLGSIKYLFGYTIFIIPILLFLTAYCFFDSDLEDRWKIFLSLFLFIIGSNGLLAVIFHGNTDYYGLLGQITVNNFFIDSFGMAVMGLFFTAITAVSIWLATPFLSYREIFEFMNREDDEDEEDDEPVKIKKIFSPKFGIETIKEDEIKINDSNGKNNKKSLDGIRTKLVNDNYKLPTLDLLSDEEGKAFSGDIKNNSMIIKRTLASFGIAIEVSEVNVGPTVTQYAIKPAEGVNVSKIAGLTKNLSLALSAHPIRIETPIPGRSLVGIESPNKERAIVRLKSLISDSGFGKVGTSLKLALGKNVSGTPIFADLAKMPHLLVAGATGSGKTICLNTLIMSLLYSNSPKTLRMILVDPKRVEFSTYNDIPHLLCPVIYDSQKTINALTWLIEEMNRRFDLLSGANVRNIGSYNSKMEKKNEDPMPFIVFIIDELADLMSTRGKELEALIVRIAQMARAVGIHLILATQRPSVNVITGLIKANVPGRIAFRVASQIDSRTILDAGGGEKLLGAGDMLFISSRSPKPVRLQNAYISEKEIKRVVDYIINSQEEDDDVEEDELSESIAEGLNTDPGVVVGSGRSSGKKDVMYEQAKQTVIETGKASSSFLQRRLSIGYARAARLIDMLEDNGIVGPSNGSKPRDVYGEPESRSEIDESDIDELI